MHAALNPDAFTRALLDPRHGALAAPLRAVPRSGAPEDPRAQGAALALAHGDTASNRRAPPFMPRLRENVRALHAAHRCIAGQALRGHHVSPAGEWLLDNVHVIAAQTRQVHDGLPRSYYRGLPVFVDGTAPGVPRVFAIAWDWIAQTDSAFDGEALVAFLLAYQDSGRQRLTLAELWALPTTLRVVLIENLRRLAERIAAEEAARESGDALCDHPAGCGPQAAVTAFARMNRRGVGAAFALQVMQRLHDDADTGTAQGRLGREAVRAALAAALPDPDAALAAQQAARVADDRSVALAIRALQAIGVADWRRIVGHTSAPMQVLLQSPTFVAERDDTQDTTLHAVERLARRSARSEAQVARELLALMRSAAQPDRIGADAPCDAAGYWIVGLGRPRLDAALGLRDGRWRTLAALARRHALGLYLAALAGGTAAVTALFVVSTVADGAPPWMRVLVAALAAWPASEIAAALLHRLCGEWLAPRHAPRYALLEGIPAGHAVLVAVPALLHEGAAIAPLAARLEQHYLANRDAQAQFALLTDWADADAARLPGDAALLAAAVQAIDALEARHRGADAPTDRPRRFLLLHRPRRWCETERQWIGWERKRGKLEQLVAVLADAQLASPFLDLGARSQPLRPTPHLLTLDSDTGLPPGALRDLMGVAVHPLNRPRVDTARGRVASGHAVLQPRIDMAWPGTGQATLFHRLFAGEPGQDPYNGPSSEVFSDLFDEATFCGKGLLHVATMQALLAGRLPEDQVLSHDLVEGVIARCGGVTDVHLLEPAATHPHMAALRQHRWIRGDWQLGPVLRRPRRHGLNGAGVWKMVDNLRRPLVAPLSLLLFALALLAPGLDAAAALGLAAAAFGLGPLLAAAAGSAPSRDDIALRHFARVAGAEVGRAVGALAWHLALWPHTAWVHASAIVLALWRSAVSRRHLLQWTPADRQHQHASRGPRRAWPARVGAVAGLAAWALALWGAGTSGVPLALGLGLGLAWAGTPWWIAWAGRAPRPAPAQASAVDRDWLRSVALDTWRYFEQHVGAHSNHLPPDNVQTVPHTTVAQRTSPTNIGMYLLSAACAQAFGWIDRAAFLARCEGTLDAIDRLPRHRGHLLNWVDTATLRALPPAYVSTVDSGNLCVLLLTVAAALDALDKPVDAGPTELPARRRHRPGPLAQRAHAAALRCRALAESHEFGFLFDERRRLFHIGCRVDDGRNDAGHYDLLASEARLASLWAIAKGDVAASHWAALGRPFLAEGSQVGLRSWSGSMFEYLMPALVLDEPAGSVLGRAARMAVAEQQRHGRQHGLPWGVSECAHAEVDATLAYQYGPQGVPRLAMRQTPADEQVVAPYASAMAAMLAPGEAAANLRQLQALGARDSHGFIEALDYSVARRLGTAAFSPVQTHMTHHQGMTLVSLAVLLLDGLPRRWAMAEPPLAAVASLLHERVPRAVAGVGRPDFDRAQAADRPAAGSSMVPTQAGEPGASALPPTQLLSNGRYAVSLRPNGAGWSRWGGADVSRWRDDALRDAFGSFVFLRRDGAAAPVSITQHPAPDAAARYGAAFDAEQAVFHASWPDLRVRCTVWVDAHSDVELRRVELWNTSAHPIALDLMSAFEVGLSPARADEMHPAFANLFVSARWDAATQSLAFARRPRRDAEAGLHGAHFVVQAGAGTGVVRAQAERARWRGRLHPAWNPLAHFGPDDALDGPRVTGLDPVAALCIGLSLPPHGSAQVTLGTAAAGSAAELDALVRRCRALPPVEPAVADESVAILQRQPGSPAAHERASLRSLATPLLLTLARPTGRAVTGDRRALWRFGVSGERALIRVRISQTQGLRLVRALVRGLGWWARGGLPVDLVVINAEPHSYAMALQQDLMALRDRQRAAAADPANPAPAGAGALHVWLAGDLTPLETASVNLLARVRLHADGRPLAQHVAELVAWHDDAGVVRGLAQAAATADDGAATWPAPPSPPARFDPDDGAARFETGPRDPTPRPWVNVLAGPEFGALVSESGGGCTWAGNSRLDQLTAWGNDVLGDMDGESFLVQDLHTRQVWRLGRPGARADIEHGPGWTRIRQRLTRPDGQPRPGDVEADTLWCVDDLSRVKRVHVDLRNLSVTERRLRVVGVAEWVMGALREDRRSVETAIDEGRAGAPALDVLLATQLDGHEGRAGQTAFLAARADGMHDARLADWTCDRRELFDERGRPVLPDRLGGGAGAGGDPCAAATLVLTLGAGGHRRAMFLIGHADTRDAAAALARHELMRDPEMAVQAVRVRWRDRLDAVQVQSPDPLFDAMVNHWLPYQTLACRLWGRAGFYQAGGAYGFRDQLQDAMGLVLPAPHLLREQLLRAAARQFVEGDVQHWWHPDTGAGARTRFSDDLLWLPHATLHYLRATADQAVLDEPVPFIEGPPIPDGAEDAYFVAQVSAQTGSLYEHAARSVDRSLAVGSHGLPLMGSGDWNDGMNRVGEQGRGESVWLGWFLVQTVSGFAPVAAARGDLARARRWQAAARGWRQALAGAAWDGAWYRRAFFDDGTPLGSHDRVECRIDLVAQAWSVLSGAASPHRQRQAMDSARQLLADERLGLWRLLDPPLVAAVPSAGYVQAYPPGVRENGAQYAHAAVWAAMAWARLGEPDEAWRTWTWLSPAHRAAHATWGPLYGLEPYAMAADVYSQPPYEGRGGWSWYTGSAGGLYRVALESICGLQVEGARLRVQPGLPAHWPSVMLRLRRQGRSHLVTVCAASAHGAIAQAQALGAVPLAPGRWLDLAEAGDASHHLVVAVSMRRTPSTSP